MQCTQDDHVGTAFHLFDHRPAVGQRPLDRRLLDIEVAEAAALGLGVDAHAVEGVHGVGRGELHPPVGVDHHDAVAHPGRLLGADVLVGIGEGRLGHHVGQTLEDVEVRPLVHARRPLERRQRDPSSTAIMRRRSGPGCSPPAPARRGWGGGCCPARSRPLCRQLAARVHCVSLIVWPTRSWSTRVGRLLGRIWPSTTSSGSSSGLSRDRGICAGTRGTGESGTGHGTRSRSEKERSARTLQLPSSRCRWPSSSGLSSVWTGPARPGWASVHRLFGLQGADGPPRTPVRHPASVPLQRADARRASSKARSRRPIGHLLQPVRVRGRGQRHTPGHEALQERERGYCSPTGLRHPADESSAAMPDVTPPPRPCGPTTRPARQARSPPP
jgi:hypothetical protein